MKMFLSMILFIFVLTPSLFAESMKTYYPDGKIQMEMSDEGMKTYYENGKLQSETAMKDGTPAGVTKMYYESGKLMREDDHTTGQWKQYDESGTVVAEGKS